MKNFAIIILIGTFILFLSCSKKRDDTQDVDGWGFANITESYDIGKEDQKYNGEPVYYLKSNRNVDSGFGALVKSIVQPGQYFDKRLKLSGYIKTENVEGSAGMWMRVDEIEQVKISGFDNMSNRPIKGTTDWKNYEIVLDIPNGSRVIHYGPLLGGNGKMFFSGLRLDTVGKDIPTTNMPLN